MRSILAVAALTALPLMAGTAVPENVVVPISAAPQLIIPAAGSVQGSNGTFFRTDMTLVNFRTQAQRVELRFLPQGGGAAVVNAITVDARSAIRSEDFTALTGVQGLGTLILTGLNTDTDTADPNANIYATVRIWTPQPGSSGTTSQSLNVVPPPTFIPDRMPIFGIRRDSRYRANVGIVNLGDAAQTFTIDVSTQAANPVAERYTVTVHPMSMEQVPLVSNTAPLSQILVTRSGGTTAGKWLAYGASVDNVTGDSWSELAASTTTPF